MKISDIMRHVAPSVGLILVLLATAAPFALAGQAWAQAAYPWVYAAGAMLLLVASFFNRSDDDTLRLRRLRHLDAMAAVAFCVGAFFLFYHQLGWGRDWIAFTLAGAAIKIFTTLATAHAEAKAKK